ncbi:MAG: type II toxin-antitoxin system VapC family toxin [Pseudomonadota bacterium]|nr:type II toxin-antitoxin system VapC family toxin [Pseudomonadota bacterium]
MFLLDTVILSELRKRERNPGLVRWIGEQRAADLYLSVVSVGEIERGIARQREVNPDFAVTLSDWLDRLLHLYSDRLIAVDLGVARRWGRLSAALGNDGADLLLAATAQEHGLTVVTRNVRHFQVTGVPVFNPFS